MNLENLKALSQFLKTLVFLRALLLILHKLARLRLLIKLINKMCVLIHARIFDRVITFEHLKI